MIVILANLLQKVARVPHNAYKLASDVLSLQILNSTYFNFKRFKNDSDNQVFCEWLLNNKKHYLLITIDSVITLCIKFKLQISLQSLFFASKYAVQNYILVLLHCLQLMVASIPRHLKYDTKHYYQYCC